MNAARSLARAAWEAANAPVPEWGWDALPEDEQEAWLAPFKNESFRPDGGER